MDRTSGMKAEEGYEVKRFAVPTKRYCKTLRLKEDPELIAAYRRAHSETESWREIREGIRAVGILEMEIYISGSLLFMVMEVPADLDVEEAMSRLATLPRQAEWEEYVAQFQECVPGSTSAEKWKLMERMFYLYE